MGHLDPRLGVGVAPVTCFNIEHRPDLEVLPPLGSNIDHAPIYLSPDRTLTASQIIDWYSLRFQIEFNLRNAKQYWGLEDCMNVSATAVTYAVNLAFLMVNLSRIMLKPYREHDPAFSGLDLKALFRARHYLDETIKMLPETPTSDLISRIGQHLARFGSIRVRPLRDFAA